MARYKHIDTSPRFLAVDLQRQLLPGTFEHAMNHLIDRELDLSSFDVRFNNDLTGATAYPPAMLLKVVLFAYSMGIISSRHIERACRDHVTFIALSGDSLPHFTTIAGFVSTLGDDIARLFSQGTIRKSNRTDNESAKMATSKGVIQGYTGVAAVDAKHQIIVEAQAHGTGSEQELLIPVVKAIKATRAETPLITGTGLITADAGYHSEDNLKELAALKVDALIADNAMRGRDERFAGQDKYKALPDPLHDKGGKPKQAARYRPKDFDYDPQAGTCICPAGIKLYGDGSGCTINGMAAIKFQGAQRDCVPCTQREHCLRTPDKTRTRQVSFFQGRADGSVSHTAKMRARIDSPEGRALYSGRFTTVEPVFGNVRYNKGLDRFTLRGRKKVDAQWKLFCLVHNIEKLAHHGYAQ